MSAREQLTGLGIWSGELRFLRDRGPAREAAAELEQLGYSALWLPGGTGTGRPLFEVLAELLDASERVLIASGILSIWVQDAASTALDSAKVACEHPGRFLLGLGTSHTKFVDQRAREQLRRPLTAMRGYLDELDAADTAGPQPERILAALGPRMLELARDRAVGAHPYFVTPAHTRFARELLGPERLLAPEQAVVLESDPAIAREVARSHMASYLELPNYTGNLLRFGFAEEDMREGGSDRLVDALVAWGDERAVAERIAEHREAGADHVALQVISGQRGQLPLAQWRRLAELLA